MNNSEQNNLMCTINQTSFAIDDVKLYLDTHPNCMDGIAYYEKMKKIRMQAVNEYTNKYGPITAYDVTIKGNTWDWNEGPLPWEGEC
jgi:spore coat protein JB